MHIPVTRRTALRASGVAVALPMLVSMNRAIGFEPDPPPRRRVLICNARGFYSPSLFPKTTGRKYEQTEYLQLLSKHRDDFSLISGLSHPDQNGKEPHDTEMTWLTAARNPGLGGFRNSISVDQFAASKLGRMTRFPVIALGTNTTESQSYNSNGVMLPAWHRPSLAFAKLFLTGTPAEMRQQRARLSDGRSILDAVADQAKALSRKVSVADRRQLDEYFAAIRDAEVDLAASEEWLDRPKPVVDAKPPQDLPDPRQKTGRIRTVLNLIPLILQTDSCRFVTVMIQDHGVVPNIPGVSGEHHPLSHHGQDPDRIKQLKLIEKEILGCFDDFLTRMKRPQEGHSQLLDTTSVVLGSNLGNANAHDPANLPTILAGGGFKHGRYIAHNRINNTPLCNLFVSVLNQTGIETDAFGTSSGALSL